MTYKGKRGCFQWHTHTHTHTHFFLSSCYLEFFVYHVIWNFLFTYISWKYICTFLCHQNNPIQKHIEKNMTNKPNDNIAYMFYIALTHQNE